MIFTAEVSKYSNPYDFANSSACWTLTVRLNDKSILLPIKTPYLTFCNKIIKFKYFILPKIIIISINIIKI